MAVEDKDKAVSFEMAKAMYDKVDAAKLPLEAGSAVGAVQSPGCIASGQYSQAFGTKYTDTITTASGMGSHAEGCGTEAKGTGTHAEGQLTYAYTGGAHAEGTRTKANASSAHAEGNKTTASGGSSHAEGSQTTASGVNSHAEGDHVTASGYVSHAEGYYTTASGMYSHAQGENTIANHLNQMVFGEYNVADPSTASEDEHGTYVEIVGNGDQQTRSNARTLDWSGNEALQGSLTLGKGTADETTVTAAQLKRLLALLN